jgi:trimeric autotransporter adhesin
MRRARRWITPANVLACLALFFALGGTGWAGQVIGNSSVGTSQLKSAAITAGKLAPGAVTRSKIGKGAVGSDALAKGGVTADKLADGVLGGVAGSKITTVNSAPVSVPVSNNGTVVTATCPSGQKAVAGGWTSGLYGYPLSEGPTTDGTGWTASFGTGDVTAATVAVSVVCLAP